MASAVSEDLQTGMIISDDAVPNPILDFEAYSKAIVKMIKSSTPKFSIGIYGEWGSGKTTLMKAVEAKLNQDNENTNILTIWFNAWRYEREEQFALVPLLKTIAYKMDERPKYKKVKEIFLKSVITAGKAAASKFVSDKYIDEFQGNLTSELRSIAKADKNTIYFHGMKQVKDTMNTILDQSPKSRIVVFIDDLDRCSPKKALEIFESIKVFLGIVGFVYVIGLSHVTISKLITAQYKESEIKGEDYIKKIIQIPINLPEWNAKDIKSLVRDLLKKNLVNKDYRLTIKRNIQLVSEAVAKNPREVKRFINNYIVAYEIFSSTNKKIDLNNLLLVQAINVRWNGFYRLMINSTPQIREEIKKYVEMDPEKRAEQLQAEKTPEGFSSGIRRILNEFRVDSEFWDFLKKRYDALLRIKKWEVYRRAAESVKEIPTPTEVQVGDIAAVAIRLDEVRHLATVIGGMVDERNARQLEDETKNAMVVLDNTPLSEAGPNEINDLLANVKLTKLEIEKLMHESGPDPDVTNILTQSLFQIRTMENVLVQERSRFN